MDENIIEIKDVRKVYRMGEERIVALNKIDLTIKRGEFCCFLGTSGSGKSTLLHILAGLEKPTKGQIKINNFHLEKMSENQLAKFRRKYVGFVFQSYNLMTTLTALENVSFPLTFKRIPKSIRDKKAAAVLKSVGLENRMRHKPSQMSGGQQQRVSIARAFVTAPEILFADEPTGNLDSKTTLEVMDLITTMARENRQTLIIVTHDVDIARYADKVIHIKDGDIENIKFNKKN